MTSKIYVREVGPREGCQIHPTIIPTEKKRELIAKLADAGVPQIEATSFVRTDKVPQMADADALLSSLPESQTTKISALYLNKKGFEKSLEHKNIFTQGWIHSAVSETFLQKNSNKTHETFFQSLSEWREVFENTHTDFHGLMLSTSFGCAYEGRKTPDDMMLFLDRVFAHFEKLSFFPKEICLADTNGFGIPPAVKQIIKSISATYPMCEVSLHLHDTRGAAIANAYIGLSEGVKIFEASVGGVGGCPFTQGASGNMATEDFLWLCNELGVETGIDLQKYISAALYAAEIFGKSLDGRVYRAQPQ